MRRNMMSVTPARGPFIPPPPGTATITVRLDDTALAECYSQARTPGGDNDYALIAA